MANLLDRFQTEVVGSKGQIADFTATISAKGDFTRIKDLEVILNSWNNILLTPTRSASFDPNYGSDLYKLVWEPADEETLSRVQEEIEYRLSLYDDRAVITDVDVSFLTSGKGFNVNISCEFEGVTGTLTLAIDQTKYFNFMEAV